MQRLRSATQSRAGRTVICNIQLADFALPCLMATGAPNIGETCRLIQQTLLQITPARDPQTVWEVGSQCAGYKHQ